MPLTLIVENGQGLANANSYASVAECDAYHVATLRSSTWNNASADDKPAALAMATRVIDYQFEFNGSRSSTTQALRWPRAYVENTDITQGYYPATILSGLIALGSTGYAGAYFPSDELPTAIKAATCELARLLLESDRTREDPAKGIRSFSVGKGAIQFTFDPADRKQVFNDTLKAMLAPFGRPRLHGGFSRVVRA